MGDSPKISLSLGLGLGLAISNTCWSECACVSQTSGPETVQPFLYKIWGSVIETKVTLQSLYHLTLHGGIDHSWNIYSTHLVIGIIWKKQEQNLILYFRSSSWLLHCSLQFFVFLGTFFPFHGLFPLLDFGEDALSSASNSAREDLEMTVTFSHHATSLNWQGDAPGKVQWEGACRG